jgi:hypothetical protein
MVTIARTDFNLSFPVHENPDRYISTPPFPPGPHQPQGPGGLGGDVGGNQSSGTSQQTNDLIEGLEHLLQRLKRDSNNKGGSSCGSHQMQGLAKELSENPKLAKELQSLLGKLDQRVEQGRQPEQPGGGGQFSEQNSQLLQNYPNLTWRSPA